MATQHHRIPHTHWSKPRSCFTASGRAKFRYDTLKEAERIVRDIARCNGERLVAYRCPYCGYFHVGHERQAEA